MVELLAGSTLGPSLIVMWLGALLMVSVGALLVLVRGDTVWGRAIYAVGLMIVVTGAVLSAVGVLAHLILLFG